MKTASKPTRTMGDDPLASDVILEQFYRPQTSTGATPDAARAPDKAKPTHYKVVCISLYTEDIEHLESLVAELKRRGHTKANKSQLIRAALAQVDLGKIQKGY
jgi:hypothetical protein